jgi:hypothetical protein
MISFSKIENHADVEACLSNRSPDKVYLVKKIGLLRSVFNFFGGFNFMERESVCKK